MVLASGSCSRARPRPSRSRPSRSGRTRWRSRRASGPRCGCTGPSSLELVHRLADHALGPEHVDVRALVLAQSLLDRRRDASRASHRQRRVAGAGGPGRGGHRPLGLLAERAPRRCATACRARPRRSGRWRRALVGVVALDHRGLKPVGSGSVLTDADHVRVPGEVGALRLQPVERVLRDRRELVAVGQQQRGADRAPREHRGRDPALPVVLVHQHHRRRAGAVARGGIERAGHAGRIGGGVAAADADRVARGARGKPSSAAASSSRPWRRAAAGALVVADAAAPERQRERDQGEERKGARHGAAHDSWRVGRAAVGYPLRTID